MIGKDAPPPDSCDALATLAENLIRLRAELNWSTREFSAHSGISLSTLYGIEHRKQRTVRLSTISVLAKALGVHVTVLLARKCLTRRPWAEDDLLALAAASLVSLRGARGYTQENLALASQVPRDIVAKIERRTRNPTLDVLQRLATALQVELHQLFDCEGSGQNTYS